MSISHPSKKLFRNPWPLLCVVLLAAQHLSAQSPGPGFALHFDGIGCYGGVCGDFVDIPNYGNLVPTNEITIEFWQRASLVQEQSTFDLKPGEADHAIAAYAPRGDGKVYWDFGDPSSQGELAYTPPVSIVGSWQHFALVASQSGNFMAIYRNGTLEAWKSGMTPFVRDNFDLMLGDYFYIGDIDEFRIWNVARTSGQIQSNYSRSLAGNEPGLVAYWRFDEGMGTILTDSSGSGLNGNLIGNSVVPYPVWVLSGAPITNPPLGSPVITTLPADNVLTHGGRLNGTVNPVGQDTTAWFQYGTTTYYESATAPIAISGTNAAFVPVNSAILNLFSGTPYHYRLVAANSAGTNAGLDSTFTTLGTPPGSPGNAIHFNGASGFAGVVAADGFGAAMPTNEITIEFWQNSTASLLQFPISLNPDSSTNHILIATPGFNNLVTWDFGNSNAQGHLEYTPPDSLVNTWQHFACVASQSGNYMAIYRNGILEARKTNMSPFIRGNYSLLMGEFFPGPWCFNGTIDEVRVWNAARTSAQIQTNMNRSLVGNEPDLVGYWRFNEGAGTTTADGSGHGFTAGLAPGPEGAPNWSSSTAPIYTTPVGIPIAVTQTPTSFTTNGATLNGNVVPEGGNAAAWFQYGATTNYGSVTPTTLIVGTNVVAVAVSNLVTSLSAGILYHCQIIATNSAGTNRGADQVFAILGLPIATTLSAAPVTSTNATLNGIVYSDGYPTTVWFQYGTTTNYGSLTSFTIAPPTNTVSFAVGNLTGGLSQGVTYHYQFVASNVVGVAYGLDIPFTPLNTNTLLSGLTFSGRPLNPMFDPAITNYIVGLNSISNATVTATLQDSNASLQLQVNGGSFSPLLSASPSAPLTFLVGFNPVNVRVTAENGMDTQTYTLNVAEFGANFLVTTTNATGPGSLSYAINVANPNPGPHVITLASNAVYACTITDNFWYGPNAFPPIASDITIEGNGATIVRATTNRLRFFYVGADPNNPATAFYNSPGAGKLTLHNLTLTNGLALGGNGGGGGAGMGGAIFSQGILVLDSVTLSGNTAQGGKGQASQTYPYSPDAAGGGMGQDGGLVFYGGGFGGKVTPAGSHGAPTNGVDGGGGGGFAIFDNANSGYGGGAANGLGGNTPNAMGGNGSGAGSSAYPNYTPGFGSHPYAAPGAPGGNFGFGGGYGGRYSENAETAGTAGSGGGVGSGGGGGIHGDVAVGQPGGGGFGGGGGAGHYGASGGFGGGAGGDTTGDNDGSVVSGGYGGGQAGLNASGCGGGAGMGGAVFNHNGSVSLINCTLALNSAGGGSASFGFAYLNSGVGAQGGSGFGGAIFNLNGSVTIQNTTLASNSVAAGISPKSNNQGTNGPPGLAAGGALYSMVYESATSRSGAVTLVNSILAGSVGGSDVVNIFPATTSVGMNLGSVLLTAREPSILQTFTNSGGIFISNGVLAADPLLGPLANNGGPTPTMLPLPGSPAIDAGDSKFAAATDQRGQPRIAGAAVDLGAVELPGAPFFTGVSFTNATQIQLQFRAVAGMAYSVLTTTDLSLTNWTVLGSATEISPGQFQFTDHLATNSPTRYYRVHHP